MNDKIFKIENDIFSIFIENKLTNGECLKILKDLSSVITSTIKGSEN